MREVKATAGLEYFQSKLARFKIRHYNFYSMVGIAGRVAFYRLVAIDALVVASIEHIS